MVILQLLDEVHLLFGNGHGHAQPRDLDETCINVEPLAFSLVALADARNLVYLAVFCVRL